MSTKNGPFYRANVNDFRSLMQKRRRNNDQSAPFALVPSLRDDQQRFKAHAERAVVAKDSVP